MGLVLMLISISGANSYQDPDTFMFTAAGISGWVFPQDLATADYCVLYTVFTGGDLLLLNTSRSETTHIFLITAPCQYFPCTIVPITTIQPIANLPIALIAIALVQKSHSHNSYTLYNTLKMRNNFKIGMWLKIMASDMAG